LWNSIFPNLSPFDGVLKGISSKHTKKRKEFAPLLGEEEQQQKKNSLLLLVNSS